MPEFRSSSERFEYERALGCEHEWQPAGMELQPGGIAAKGNRCLLVCLKCAGLSYIETWWVGYCDPSGVSSGAVDD